MSEKPSATVFELDEYDWWHFRRLAAHAPELAETLTRRRTLLPLAFDLYGMLYKPYPAPRDGRTDSLSASIIKVLEQHTDLTGLRERTMLDEWSTVAALPGLLAPMEEAVRRSRHRGQRDRVLEAAHGAHDDTNGNEASNNPPSTEGLRQALAEGTGLDALMAGRTIGARAAHEALDHYEQARAELEEFDRQNRLDILPDARGASRRETRRGFGRRRMKPEPPWRRRGVPRRLRAARDELVKRMRRAINALEDVKRELREAEQTATRELAQRPDPELLKAGAEASAAVDECLRLVAEVKRLARENDTWGRERGQLQGVPLDELVRLGELLRKDRSLREIVEIVGRWSITLKRRFPRGKSPHGRAEAYEVGVGCDLTRLVAAELAQLRHPLLRKAALARILERRALVTALRGPHLLGRGPVIAVVDTSRSMSGDRLKLAKALVLALALRSMEKRRPFYLLTFGAPGELHEDAFYPRTPFMPRLLACIGFAYGGGTDFDGPLRRVCELARDKPWSTADAVFVTDGECIASADVRERVTLTKRRTDLQIIGALVGSGQGLTSVVDHLYALGSHALGEGAALDRLLERLSTRL